MNKPHFFYNLARKISVQFCDIFSDIKVARYNKGTGEILKYVKVPMKFAPKTKQWYWKEITNTDGESWNVDKAFPIIGISLENVEYNSERQVNRNSMVVYETGSMNVKKFFNPVPYDFQFTVQIAAYYTIDILQIIEQVLPYFTPENYIEVQLPELSIKNDSSTITEPLMMKVVYNDATKDEQTEIDETLDRVIIWTLNFTVQGYLLKPVTNESVIKQISINYFIDPKAWEQQLSDDNFLDGRVKGVQAIKSVITATGIPIDNPDTPDVDESDIIIDEATRQLYDYELYEAFQPIVIVPSEETIPSEELYPT